MAPDPDSDTDPDADPLYSSVTFKTSKKIIFSKLFLLITVLFESRFTSKTKSYKEVIKQ
jgi:hypothetical protein